MRTYRQKAIASLCLLLAVSAVLMRPAPARAEGNRSRRVAFSPVWVAPGQGISFWYFNSGTRPTPQATVTFVNILSGSLLGEFTLNSEPPGRGRGDQLTNPGPGAQLIAVVVTFSAPAAGQAIPNPLPGNVQVWEAQTPVVVIGPAR